MSKKKRKNILKLIWESLIKTGGCCGSGESCCDPEKKSHFQTSLTKKGGNNPGSKTLKPQRIPPSQKVKKKNKNEFNPDYRVPPSFTLMELVSYFLKEHTNSNLEPDEWNELMNNRLKIDDRIAEELEKVFSISKQMWLNLQNNYDKK